MSRFINIPTKLRSGAAILAKPDVTDGQFMAITGWMEDAAFKIEALEREMIRLVNPKTPS